MKRALTVVLALFGSLGSLTAKELPAMFDKPFLGCFLGFQGSRDFEFAIGGDGTSELFFIKDKKALRTNGLTLHIYYVVQEQMGKGTKKRWVNRTLQKDGFETEHEATAEPPVGKPIAFVATFTGDTKVECSHVLSKDKVEIATKIVSKKTKNPVRVGVRVVVGDMYRHVREEEDKLSERELKTKVKGSEIAVWPVGSRKRSGEKIDLYEIDVELPKKFPKGARKFALESPRLGDHKYSVSTASLENGTITFRQTKKLLHGFDLFWWPDPEKADDKDTRLVIEVD